VTRKLSVFIAFFVRRFAYSGNQGVRESLMAWSKERYDGYDGRHAGVAMLQERLAMISHLRSLLRYAILAARREIAAGG
jgi:hypothetical protein